jgi:hypothetical protein
MSAKTPPNPVTGPPQPPGFTGLRRWTDIRAVAPLLLIAAAIWMFTQPLAITQPADARNASDKGAMVIDSTDLVARAPEPHETLTPKPHPTPSPVRRSLRTTLAPLDSKGKPRNRPYRLSQINPPYPQRLPRRQRQAQPISRARRKPTRTKPPSTRR